MIKAVTKKKRNTIIQVGVFSKATNYKCYKIQHQTNLFILLDMIHCML